MQILQKIKSNSDYKRLFENFISLSILQGLNYILPLVTFPYLVRVLGVEKFGLLSFTTATIAYFQILTDYGFNLSATREVAINRDNKEKLNEIFSSVMIIKFGLLIISFLLLSVLVFSFEKFRQDWLVYYLSFGMVVGQVLFPVWFFQGMEKMKYITFLNVLAKVLFTIAIFIFVKQQSDYWKVPLLNSMGFISAGVLSLLIVYKNWNIGFKFVGFESILRELKEGWHIFIGTMCINFYKNNSIIILGLFTNETTVGYFYIAKKIIDILNQIAGLISQSIYPHVSILINRDISRSVKFLKKLGIFIAIYTFILGLLLLVFSPLVIHIVSGHYYEESIISLKLMAFVPMFIGINVPAVQILLSKGLGKQFSSVVLVGAILDILLNFSLVPYFSYIGSCLSVLIVELFVTVYFYVKIFNLKLQYGRLL